MTIVNMLDEQKKFELLFEVIKDAYKEHLDTGLKISAVLLVVFGWFVSSVSPLTILCGSPALGYLALVFVVAGAVSLFLVFRFFYIRAERAYSAIRALEPDDSLYRYYRIPRLMFLGTAGGHLLMMSGIAFLIVKTYVYNFAHTCR